jgi:hypothetical protein
LQIFLTGKYKTTEKIKDFFGWRKNQRASREGHQNPRIATGFYEIWKNDFKRIPGRLYRYAQAQ